MTYTEILHEQVEQLPPSYQAEASRYLESLLQKVGVAKSPVNEVTPNDELNYRQELFDIMTEVAREGGTVFDRENIDVMAWQKETRQDKVLGGREEE